MNLQTIAKKIERDVQIIMKSFTVAVTFTRWRGTGTIAVEMTNIMLIIHNVKFKFSKYPSNARQKC